MKEININIEGYNVNGICVGCLSYNRRMFYHRDIKECFRLLGNIDVPDGLEIQVCWECLAYIRSALKFKEQMLQSFDFLINYSQEHTFLDSPNDFIPHSNSRVNNFIKSEIDSCDLLVTEVLANDDKSDDIKIEENEIKYDFDTLVVKEESSNHSYTEVFQEVPVENDVTSDEDVQLSKIKEKEDRGRKKIREDRKRDRVTSPKNSKEKKQKSSDNNEQTEQNEQIEENEQKEKKGRKLLNLPEEMVELYTMREDEMWTVRIEDLISKDFQKLKYRCDNCIKSFNTQKLMQDHMNGKHQPKSIDCHQCNICKAYFLTKDNVSAHKKLHLQSYRCIECGFVTTVKRIMSRHVANHKHVYSHICYTCGTSFNTKSKLAYHRGVCSQEKPQCDCCGKVFANKMTLKYHLNRMQPQKDSKPKQKLFIPCKGCDKVFHTKKSYRAHVVIHDGVSYPCPICGKLFQWKRNLARHTRNHRERDAGNTHACRACNKTFASRDCYNNHMRLSKKHVGADTFQHECTYCGKKFATKWCLTDHVDWDHLKIIKYQCSVCFKAFKTAKILVVHVNNIHEGKKKEIEGEHLCEICGKSYKTVKRLKGHVWSMHTNRPNSKMYKCKLCPATFMWQTSIYKHTKMMHDNKKNKPPRPPPVKKEEPYPGIELANRMQYFQQNIGGNLNLVQIQPGGISQNIV
uniref:C2H2-type domain-containing protein n=1 Tax=Heliothis virescens TaxID=7102 RepID=A0A2A4K6F4_HELVI